MPHPSVDEVQGVFDAVRLALPDKTIVDALTMYLPCDDVPTFNLGDFAEYLIRMYDL